ncbi:MULTISPECIES: C25 family cysteine peptidase [Pseudarthrobacter]|uniref:C25 family cysteine peptidase n=1 Tax=Pseudarthrobacter TaxID=1742993 RepID=UPI0013D96147|nr:MULTISPECIES: C25 family cysteine peptidase [Pseudarthrobacter]MDQ0000105.1 hypothetical protein [Pseudarthrobacter sulfonivorans]
MIVSNGIDAHTGKPLIEISEDELAELIVDAEGHGGGLRQRLGTKPRKALPWQVVPTDVSHAGWSVVFAHGESDEVRQALEPLVQHRRDQVEEDCHHRHEYFPGEEMVDWLARQGVNPGAIDPSRVGYYVLIVGSPARIPFEFQYLLDIEYAVGRVAFDTPEEYRQYANSVVDSETSAPAREKVVAYWGTLHPWDRATKLSADHLLGPLVPDGAGQRGLAERHGFRSTALIGEQATKAGLLELIAGNSVAARRPSLLVTASHGLGGLAADDPEQRRRHGALVTQDWNRGPVGIDVTVAGTDISGAQVHGMVAFLFACYSAGTPMIDDFPVRGQPARQIADEPFVAYLPQRLLAHPNGGALAVIGHVERAWGYSIVSAGGSQQRFEDTFAQIMCGVPVGHSMRMFNDAYAVLSANLTRQLNRVAQDMPAGAGGRRRLLELWMEWTDVQNYVVLGDPAVRLRG